jgi:hypothetical protein
MIAALGALRGVTKNVPLGSSSLEGGRDFGPNLFLTGPAPSYPVHEDPYHPITAAGKRVLAETLEHEVRIGWWPRKERYAERLAPGTKFATDASRMRCADWFRRLQCFLHLVSLGS